MTEDEYQTVDCGLRQVQVKLGHMFADVGLLELALTHSSVAVSLDNADRSNERLEFLGDRVLGLTVADLVYHKFSNENEGSLARRHAALVRREAVADVAERLGLGDHIRMSRGEIDAGGQRNIGLLSNTCEAVIAAIYLDAGLENAARFVCRNWLPLLTGQAAPPTDPKTALQEWVQARGLALPEYQEIDRQGPPHAPKFCVEVSVQDMLPVRATGTSKRMAERAAAEQLMNQVRAKYGP